MAPKKKKKEVEEDPISLIDTNDERDLDLVVDINPEFFQSANKTIQLLMKAKRLVEASKVKFYVDLVQRLHSSYTKELTTNEKLRPLINDAETKLKLALEISAQSEACMQQLKHAVSDAWKEIDDSRLNEQNMQDKLQAMFVKCMDFEIKEKDDQDQDAEFGALAKYKSMVLRERDRLNAELLDMEKRLQMQRFYSESLEYINHTTEDEKHKILLKERALDHEKHTLEIKVKNLNNIIEDLKESKHWTSLKLDEANRNIADLQARLAKKTSDFERCNYNSEKLRNETIMHNRIISKQEDDMKGYRKDLTKNEEIIKALRLEDKMKTNMIRDLQKKNKTAMQDINNLETRLYQCNRLNNQFQSDVARLKNQLNSAEKDVMSTMNRLEDLRILKENIQRERDNLRSDVVKLNNNIADLRHNIMMNNIAMDGLNLDIRKLNVKLDEAKNLVAKVEKERDEMAQEIESLHTRMEYLQETIQLKTEQLNVLTEKFEQKHKMLMNFKKQLEVANSEKLILKRNFDTCVQERDDFKNQNIRNSHQIAQLSAEIHANVMQINSMNLTIDRLKNEKKDLETALKNAELLIASLRKELKDMRTKNESLMKTIAEDEKKFLKIKQELEETRKERNLVGLQMVRRNDEITLVKEKMSIMQNALDNGTAQYNQRLEDIRLMKLEISNLQTERECLSRAIKSTASMREETVRLQRLLNQERIRVRSLMEDAKTPTAVHRWRILKGEDPHKYQLLRKVQVLQKRNLKIEASKINLRHTIEKLEDKIVALEEAVHHSLKNDVMDKLVIQQRKSNLKDKKLRALTAELRITETEAETQKCLIDDYKSRLNLSESALRKVQNLNIKRKSGAMNKSYEHAKSTRSLN